VLRGAGAFAVLTVVAALLVLQPALAAGVVLGGALVYVTVTWPLVVVGLMLALGPLDLSFVTGGFKGLFPQFGGLDMNGIRLVGISAALLVVVATDRASLAQLARGSARWYVLFLVWAVLTLAWSRDPLEGARLLFKLTYPLLVFLVIASPGRTREEVVRVADGVLIGAALILLLNPFLVAAGGYQFDIDGRLRVGGLGLHENPFSFYLLVVILMCVGRFAVRGGVRYLLLAGLAAAWMTLTLTRITLGAGLAGLGGLALYGVLVSRNYRLAGAAAGIALLIGLALGPVALERSFGFRPSFAQLSSYVADPVGLFNAVSWSGREEFWPALVAAWGTAPLTGLGLGTSSMLMQTVFPPEAGGVAHNEYLRLGVDSGLVGVLLFAVAAFAWLGAALRAGRSPARGVGEFALPALGGMLAWAIISATDNAFDYYSPFTQFMGFLVGGAMVLAREQEPATSLDPSETPGYLASRV